MLKLDTIALKKLEVFSLYLLSKKLKTMHNFFNSPVLRIQVLVICAFFILFSSNGCYAFPGNEINETSISIPVNFNPKIEYGVDTTFQNLVVNEDKMRGGLLFDATANKIVWHKDLHYAYPIASLTKMMVALLVVEDINNCRADWNDEISYVKQYVKRVKRKKVKYAVRETYTLDALFHLAMIASNNEACMEIAKHLAGNVDDFVGRMNARARELEMKNTYYSNPSGLPAGRSDLDNSSSPLDLLKLSLEMLKYPEITSVTKIGYADIANERSSGIYRNHNRLVIDYENEVDGLKTGYTKNARFCLAATSYKANHRLISIVLGVPNPSIRNEIVADMLSNYYEKLGVGRLANNIPLPKDNIGTEPSEQIAENDPGAYKTVWTLEKKFHIVKKGENLSTIATRYNCSINAVKKWNHKRTSLVLKGEELMVYVNVKKKIKLREDQIQKDENEEEGQVAEQSEKIDEKIAAPVSKSTTAHKKPTAKPAANFVYHIVQPGDTLWNIAQKYKGVTVADIKKTNKISKAKGLQAGTKLKIILNT